MGLSSVFKKAFPFIAAAASIGGPLGTMAAQAVGNAIGVDVKPAEIDDAIAKAATTNPDAMLKLQEAEHDFQIKMAQLGYDNVETLEQIAAADRASARARETILRDYTPRVLAGFITFGFFGILAMLAFVRVEPMAHDILVGMVGVLGTAFIGITNYYFGSSSSSARKTEIIAEKIEK